MSNIMRGLGNILAQNPKGSAAEKILLNRFLSTQNGIYAKNTLANDGKNWVMAIKPWLERYKDKFAQEFPEVDFSDIQDLAEKFYENFLAMQGQLEEDQAPMFTPEEEHLDENESQLKQNALKVMYDAIMIPMRGSRLYPTNETDFEKMASISLQQMFAKRYSNLTRQQIASISQKAAEAMLDFYRKEPGYRGSYKQAPMTNVTRESSIMKGLTKD